MNASIEKTKISINPVAMWTTEDGKNTLYLGSVKIGFYFKVKGSRRFVVNVLDRDLKQFKTLSGYYKETDCKSKCEETLSNYLTMLDPNRKTFFNSL